MEQLNCRIKRPFITSSLQILFGPLKSQNYQKSLRDFIIYFELVNYLHTTHKIIREICHLVIIISEFYNKFKFGIQDHDARERQ